MNNQANATNGQRRGHVVLEYRGFEDAKPAEQVCSSVDEMEYFASILRSEKLRMVQGEGVLEAGTFRYRFVAHDAPCPICGGGDNSVHHVDGEKFVCVHCGGSGKTTQAEADRINKLLNREGM